MKINVGSQNKAKLEAVQEAISSFPIFDGAEVHGLKVESGISEQPMTMEDTVQGAINRAKNAFKNCDYSVGYESGLIPVPHTKTGFLDIGFCVIFDGKELHIGCSSGFEYPIKMVEIAKAKGVDMDQAALETRITDHPDIGTDQGVVGILTRGRVTRKEQAKQAVIMALMHLENQEHFK